MAATMGSGSGTAGQPGPLQGNYPNIPPIQGVTFTTNNFSGGVSSFSAAASGSVAGSNFFSFAPFTAPGGTSGAGTGGSANGGGASLQGFSFTPPPLVLNGQTVAGGLNFTAAVPIAQVDQAQQAYNFINTLNSQAYGFVGNAINLATQGASATNSQVIGLESQFGTGEVAALQTLAQAEQTAASKLSSGGCSGLGCLF